MSPSTAWAPQTPTGKNASQGINQFLELHGCAPVYKGSPIITIGGQYGNWTTISGVMLDQPFVQPAGQTTIGWTRIPVTNQGLPAPYGDSLTDYPSAVDLTVSICADSGGLPGAVIASVPVPHELVEQAGSASWPEPMDPIPGPTIPFPQTEIPAVPGVGYSLYSFISAGSWVLGLGYNSATTLAYLFAAQYEGIYSAALGSYTQGLGPWMLATQLPLTTTGPCAIAYCPTAQVVAIAFYPTGGPTQVYTASFDQTGAFGAWQLQATPSSVFEYPTLGVITDPTDQNDYLVIFSNGFGGAVVGDQYIQVGQVQTGGNVQAWRNGPDIPEPQYVGAPSWNPEGYILSCQRPSDGACLALVPAASNTFRVWALTGQAGPWVYVGSLPETNVPAVTPPTGLAWCVGDSLNIGGYSASFSSQGMLEPWSTGNVGLPAAFSNPDGTYGSLGTATGQQQMCFPMYWINVPLAVSGLTPGATYHLVVTGGAGSAAANATVPLNEASGQPTCQYSTNGGVSWTTIPACAVPLLVFAGATGDLVGLIDDGGARISTLWFDSPTHTLLDAAQWSGANRAVQVLGYAGSDVVSIEELV